jgi:replicative DNA helicase
MGAGEHGTGGSQPPGPTASPAEVMAEAALLGALIWDPSRLQHINWLEPTDLYRPSHRAIYQTLIGLVTDGEPVDPQSLLEALHRGKYHDLHIDNAAGNGPLSAFAVSELLSMTPASPTHSQHHRYAEIVLEASIRRQVLDAGASIEQTALGYANHPVSHAFNAMDRVLGTTTTRLDDLTQRLSESTELASAVRAALDTSTQRTTSTPARTTSAIAEALVTDAGSASAGTEHSALPLDLPAPSPARLRHAEHALIGACLAQPGLRQIAQDRLRAEDFAQPEVAATWQVLADLASRGEPIDFVLLAAEIQRHGDHPDHGPGLEPRELATLARRADVVSGPRAASLVIRAALSRAAENVHAALAEAGADRGRNSAELLGAARRAIERIDAVRSRLAGEPAPRPRDRSTVSAAVPRVATRVATTPQRPPRRVIPRAVPPVPRQVGRSR